MTDIGFTADHTAPTYKLNSPAAVAIATFIGSGLAGAWLMAENCKMLGQRDQLKKVWGLGVGLPFVMLALSLVLPDSVPGMVFTVAQTVVMQMLAKQRFETALAAHGASGGSVFSKWRAAGIGLLFALALLAVLIAIIAAMMQLSGLTLSELLAAAGM
ncbi:MULTISPECIES: hypothetical protein [Chromobacterium]|uniref:Uncharacterized protein n=2 Tax=Chromobacterium TaxID=535 RepID=A0ABS3GM16_9NEIS|nr:MULTISPECIES: hypothetical protein [Chromobacterium]AXT46766.1 hypothetical protein D1345_11435 [Chromobacterium rhizoryzae]MBK0414305.1 hypothetical protein [Chromobacterium haemolyticum]MBO0415684.1 hypothetical protein [Chromobacterium haemolyticum]MBO0498800.1 hypothetical protein [Chromobacterium haemolyticum]OQS38483.1 hypothetical protein B0T40_06000 [Chromobacterium haemolyticum]